jgi:hypothetical protein
VPRGAERAARCGIGAEQEDVGALDVAVHDPQRVHVRERRAELRQQPAHLRLGKPPAGAPLLADEPREVATFAELHDDADVLSEHERVLKAHHVRVRELAQDLDLVSRQRPVLRGVDRHALECQELAVSLAPDQRDRPHRALTQRALVLVGVHRSVVSTAVAGRGACVRQAPLPTDGQPSTRRKQPKRRADTCRSIPL